MAVYANEYPAVLSGRFPSNKETLIACLMSHFGELITGTFPSTFISSTKLGDRRSSQFFYTEITKTIHF